MISNKTKQDVALVTVATSALVTLLVVTAAIGSFVMQRSEND